MSHAHDIKSDDELPAIDEAWVNHVVQAKLPELLSIMEVETKVIMELSTRMATIATRYDGYHMMCANPAVVTGINTSERSDLFARMVGMQKDLSVLCMEVDIRRERLGIVRPLISREVQRAAYRHREAEAEIITGVIASVEKLP